MAFRFSLAAVLLVRENAKKRAEQDLHTVQLEIGRINGQIETFDRNIAYTHIARERAIQQPIPAGEVQTFDHRVKTITESKKKLLDQLQSLELERDRRMKIYHEAHRNLETIVEMFSEQRTAHDQEQSRKEQKQLDDIFAARSVKEANNY
ncbi:MAG: flagellar export protein FliJ [Terracidiphilus sp.]|jgi:flagellar export protein FliJ